MLNLRRGAALNVIVIILVVTKKFKFLTSPLPFKNGLLPVCCFLGLVSPSLSLDVLQIAPDYVSCNIWKEERMQETNGR